MWRSLVASAVLVAPLAFTLPKTIRHDVDAIRDHSRLTAVQAEVEPPFRFPGYRNVPLLLGIRRLVPTDADVAFVPRGSAEIYLQTGWLRWAAFVIAPRVVVEGRDARWIVVVDRTPREAKVRGRRAWRFGDDWLVAR